MPILSERPTYEWVARVNQKHKQLAGLLLSVDDKQKLDRWTEIEFVYSTLRLEGVDLNRDLVAGIAARRASSQAPPEDSVVSGSESALLETLRAVTSIAREQGKDSTLSVDLLLELNNKLIAQDRTSNVTAENLPLALDSACQWFTADSFVELHPIEQASIVLLRLIDIKPFDQTNERTALVAASLFTLRSGLPPIIIEPDAQPAYRAALEEGLRMNTKPMVEFVADSIGKILGELIRQVK